MDTSNTSYWNDLSIAAKTVLDGLRLTFSHILQSRKSRKNISVMEAGYFNYQEGIATIQYPHETIPVPDNGRYKLHNEIDDCIVCDKCAKVCPVDCIYIEPIKSSEEIGKTSDGTPKRIYAAKFDIDMSKCCFCGLCTTVCPTECLTMTKEYDYSVIDITSHNFVFGDMTAEQIVLKKNEWEQHQALKAASVASATTTSTTTNVETAKPAAAKPVFRPKIKPPSPPNESTI